MSTIAAPQRDPVRVWCRIMANEELVSAVKRIVGQAKAGDLDAAYVGYRELFESPAFATYRPEDQRQALKLMVLAKVLPSKRTPTMVEAHQSAIAPLTALVELQKEPGDHELLGMCHVIVGNEDVARAIFRTGLALERERNAQSDLCGSFMKRISFL
jgi:hypothetical protein